MPRVDRNGSCAREIFGSAGFLCPGSPTCVQLPPTSFGDESGGFNRQRRVNMDYLNFIKMYVLTSELEAPSEISTYSRSQLSSSLAIFEGEK